MFQRNSNVRYDDEAGYDRKRMIQEEEEEDSEIRESYLRLAYMYENCSENTQKICQLIDEQREMLDGLCMEKRKWFC